MLSSLNLKNFKPFENQSFSLKPLTLLAGLNSTGKSSLLQSLLLLRQSSQQDDLLDRVGLALNGDLVSIGTAQDALFKRAKEDSMTLEIGINNNMKGTWVFNYDRQADIMQVSSLSNADAEIYNSSLFTDNFHYLKAERIAPRNYFPMSDFQVKQHQQLGSQGEFTIHFLSINEFKIIPHHQLLHPSAQSDNLKNQVEAWLGEISPGTRVDLELHSTMDLANLQYSYEDNNSYRSSNVGFGITYILPILVAILSATSDTLILLENPEAHLHPKGQSKMGQLIALAANCGVQIILETHSDHVLNGIRKAVRHHKLDAQKVQINYFERYLEKGQPITEIITPRIYPDGGIDKWPDGFFDQAEKDLMDLL
ncbi:AAA family ATPase [Anabaena sp. WFMT]|uniref:AAA family ATPase n=1 Tax=Anabaena sp. WFMT TaxID=3449730 RepID=UPI003F281E3B